MKNSFFILSFLCIITLNAQINDFKDVDFTKADNIAKLNNGENLKNLPLLTYKLTNKLPTDVEKFRAIYSWICHNVKGDFRLHSNVTNKRIKFKNDSTSFLNWNRSYKKIIFQKLLKHKKTMCTGYAYLLEQMAKIANIECKIIDGYGRGNSTNINNLDFVNHSWNAVKLNNKWYLCDATWSSGYMVGNGIFINDYNDGYFLTKPSLFAKNHFPLNKKWLLTTTISEYQFLNAPIVYGELFKYKIDEIRPKNLNFTVKKNTDIDFSYQTLNNLSKNRINLVFYSGNIEKKLTVHNKSNSKNSLKFTTKFKNRGTYDIHLKINNDIVLTHTVKVIK